jgi:hypothetical protein
MTVRVLGVGIGLFVVIAIWIFAVVSCVISRRTQKSFGTVVVAVATLVTLILVLIPRDTEVPKKGVLKASTSNFFTVVCEVLQFSVKNVWCTVRNEDFCLWCFNIWTG